jgi:hypothetical protein
MKKNYNFYPEILDKKNKTLICTEKELKDNISKQNADEHLQKLNEIKENINNKNYQKTDNHGNNPLLQLVYLYCRYKGAESKSLITSIIKNENKLTTEEHKKILDHKNKLGQNAFDIAFSMTDNNEDLLNILAENGFAINNDHIPLIIKHDYKTLFDLYYNKNKLFNLYYKKNKPLSKDISDLINKSIAEIYYFDISKVFSYDHSIIVTNLLTENIILTNETKEIIYKNSLELLQINTLNLLINKKFITKETVTKDLTNLLSKHIKDNNHKAVKHFVNKTDDFAIDYSEVIFAINSPNKASSILFNNFKVGKLKHFVKKSSPLNDEVKKQINEIIKKKKNKITEKKKANEEFKKIAHALEGAAESIDKENKILLENEKKARELNLEIELFEKKKIDEKNKKKIEEENKKKIEEEEKKKIDEQNKKKIEEEENKKIEEEKKKIKEEKDRIRKLSLEKLKFEQPLSKKDITNIDNVIEQIKNDKNINQDDGSVAKLVELIFSSKNPIEYFKIAYEKKQIHYSDLEIYIKYCYDNAYIKQNNQLWSIDLLNILTEDAAAYVVLCQKSDNDYLFKQKITFLEELRKTKTALISGEDFLNSVIDINNYRAKDQLLKYIQNNLITNDDLTKYLKNIKVEKNTQVLYKLFCGILDDLPENFDSSTKKIIINIGEDKLKSSPKNLNFFYGIYDQDKWKKPELQKPEPAPLKLKEDQTYELDIIDNINKYDLERSNKQYLLDIIFNQYLILGNHKAITFARTLITKKLISPEDIENYKNERISFSYDLLNIKPIMLDKILNNEPTSNNIPQKGNIFLKKNKQDIIDSLLTEYKSDTNESKNNISKNSRELFIQEKLSIININDYKDNKSILPNDEKLDEAKKFIIDEITKLDNCLKSIENFNKNIDKQSVAENICYILPKIIENRKLHPDSTKSYLKYIFDNFKSDTKFDKEQTIHQYVNKYLQNDNDAFKVIAKSILENQDNPKKETNNVVKFNNIAALFIGLLIFAMATGFAALGGALYYVEVASNILYGLAGCCAMAEVVLVASQIISLSIGINFHKENSKYNQIIDKIISEKDDDNYLDITIKEATPAKRKTSSAEKIINSLNGTELDKEIKTTIDKITEKARSRS